jgi:hypothetical protein
VIGLGLRLVLSGGREAITRLVVLAVAVGLGVGLLLTVVAATNAVSAWSSRHAWWYTGTVWEPAGPAAGVAALWWHPSGDTFEGRQITRFDVAATGASSPVPPGIPRDPAAGQYYASPTPRPRSPRCCAALRRTSWPTATPVASPARSATPDCRRRTRWSSSSGVPRHSWRSRPTACR